MLYRLLRGTHSRYEEGELRSYDKGSKIELSKEEANSILLRKRIERIRNADDDDDWSDFKDGGQQGPKPADSILKSNSPDVLAYLDEHSDDRELLTSLQEEELKGKRRKGVLDKIEELLGGE